jgi:hypothetical protein
MFPSHLLGFNNNIEFYQNATISTKCHKKDTKLEIHTYNKKRIKTDNLFNFLLQNKVDTTTRKVVANLKVFCARVA